MVLGRDWLGQARVAETLLQQWSKTVPECPVMSTDLNLFGAGNARNAATDPC